MTEQAIPAISVEKLRRVDHKGTKAFVDLNIAGLVIKDFRVVERKDESLFIGNPSKVEDGEWYSTSYVEKGNKALRDAIESTILSAFESDE